MVQVCCGEKRTSNFCPDCGKKLNTSPLVDLLAYCFSAAEKQRQSAETAKQNAVIRKGNAEAERSLKTSQRMDRTADKWQAWADALAELLRGG